MHERGLSSQSMMQQNEAKLSKTDSRNRFAKLEAKEGLPPRGCAADKTTIKVTRSAEINTKHDHQSGWK